MGFLPSRVNTKSQPSMCGNSASTDLAAEDSATVASDLLLWR